MRKIDRTGQRYGRLIVIGEAEKLPGNKNTRWLCRCDCGNTTKVFTSHLASGAIISCGCYGAERRTKHGLRRHRLYNIWDNMKRRCSNPQTTPYDWYGGRGIMVCQEWQENFQAFYDWAMANGYEEGLEIDRINNDGNYEPGNCRWVTHQTNCQNR